jgi:hypothetical protein
MTNSSGGMALTPYFFAKGTDAITPTCSKRWPKIKVSGDNKNKKAIYQILCSRPYPPVSTWSKPPAAVTTLRGNQGEEEEELEGEDAGKKEEEDKN